MQEELDILRIVEDNPSISQRKISEETGISLGQVNFLIKKCVKKGLIKIEGQTVKSIKYNITPSGISEKARLTAQYIKLSYAAIMSLTSKIRETIDMVLASNKPILNNVKELFVYGSEDEMMEVVKLALKDKELELKLWNGEKGIVLYWESDYREKLADRADIIAVNILEK